IDTRTCPQVCDLHGASSRAQAGPDHLANPASSPSCSPPREPGEVQARSAISFGLWKDANRHPIRGRWAVASVAVWGAGQFEGEARALARSLALGAEGAAQFPGCQRAAVEAKAMAVLASGEAVVENPGQVLLGNTDAVVDDRHFEATLAVGEADGDLFVWP